MVRDIARLLGQRDALLKFGQVVAPGQLPAGVPAPVPAPAAPRPVGLQATKMGPAKPMAPKPLQAPTFQAFRPPQMASPVPPVQSPVSPIQQGMLGQQNQAQVQAHQKLGEWSLRPKAKLPPGRIHPDNGESLLGSNLDLPRNDRSQAIHQAFDSLRASAKNPDIGPVGAVR